MFVERSSSAVVARLLVAIAGIAGGHAALASVPPISADFAVPDQDRWMYPFNFAAGAETRASLFAALRVPGFDDRDSGMIVGFDMRGAIPSDSGRLRYKILKAELSVFVENNNAFSYDPTPDPLASSYATSDPEHVADTDPSKPIEVWPVGFRGGFDTQSWQETSRFFGGNPLTESVEGVRHCYPALLDNFQQPTDMSRQVRQKLSGSPITVGRLFDGTNAELARGALVPQGTRVRFNLLEGNSNTYVYLQNAMNKGVLLLTLATLEPTTGGPGGGTGGVTYPRIFTKESPTAQANNLTPQLSLIVAYTCDADLNGDDVVDDLDFQIFAAAYNELLDARADLNLDGLTDDADFSLFAAAYNDLVCPS
jgi:hypothetical protein